MTPNEQILIDLLFEIRKIEEKCKRLQVPIAIPPNVYDKFIELRSAISEWAIDCVVEERKQ